jgi:hypothetical protein
LGFNLKKEQIEEEEKRRITKSDLREREIERERGGRRGGGGFSNDTS